MEVQLNEPASKYVIPNLYHILCFNKETTTVTVYIQYVIVRLCDGSCNKSAGCINAITHRARQ